MAWDGLYQLHMFHKTPQSKGFVKIPENLHNLLNAVEEDLDTSDFAQETNNSSTGGPPGKNEDSLCKNDSIIDLIDGQVEHERPFSDDELDPMIDDFAEDEVWYNTEWRNRLERKLKKKIADAKEYNLMIKEDPTKKFFREREIDPYWFYLLKEIEYTNGHEQVKAASQEVQEKDNGIYTEEDEILQNESGTEEAIEDAEDAEGLPELEGSEVAEGDTSETDLHNQGLAEIDSKDLEDTDVVETRDNDPSFAENQMQASTTRDDTDSSSESESSEDDQIVVITGHEIANNLQNEESTPVNRRFDHLQFKARLKIFAEREPFKVIEINNNKKSKNYSQLLHLLVSFMHKYFHLKHLCG